MRALFVFVILCLLLNLTEIITKTIKNKNPTRNIKKRPHRNVLPEKPIHTSKRAKNLTANIAKNATENAKNAAPPPPFRRWKYKDYIRKFDATTIYERTERRFKRSGINASRDEIYEKILEQIDPTDDLLRFTPDRSDWSVLFGPQYRRTYLPPGTFLPRDKFKNPLDYGSRYAPDVDPYGVRPRIYELMKQVIYQSRDKMTIMQKLRGELNQSALFRMGFLFGKTDQSIKDFHSVIYKAHYMCSAVRQLADWNDMYVLEVLTSYERAVMHWFESELLWDLVNRNDRVCKEVIKRYHTNRKEEFNKLYIN